MLRLTTILLTALLCATTLLAQEDWRVSRLDVGDGLSQGYIYAIHQDKKGFIWIGTHGGLNRYDGYRFKVFQYSPTDSLTLADNAVFFLKEDPATGKFWIGGSSALNEFDPETFTNKRYSFKSKQLEYSDGLFVSPGKLLLACEYAVLLFDTQLKTFREIPVLDRDGHLLDIARVENISQDGKGNYLVMSAAGIFVYDSVSQTCVRKTGHSPDFSFLDDVQVFDVTRDSRGHYWIATNGKGLITMNGNAHATLTLPAPLPNTELRFDKVVEDSRGNIWAGSSDGLFRINPVSGTVEPFVPELNTVSLRHDEINFIYEDRNHFVWVGTVGKGVCKMVPVKAGFRHFELVSEANNTGSYIMAIQQLDNDIWFTNIWDQLGRIDKMTGASEIIAPRQFARQYRWYSEGTIVRSKPDQLTLINGEFQYHIGRRTNEKSTIAAKRSPGLCYQYRTRRGKWLTFVKLPVSDPVVRQDTIFGNQFFYDVVEGTDETLWMGTSKGLLQYVPSKNSFVSYRHDVRNTNTISSDFIYSLEMDNSGEKLWMAAYNGGLCSYDIQRDSFRHYGTQDGLADNTVYAIEKDDHGNLWFSSNAGISAYDARAKTFRNYSTADGLLNYEFDRRASFRGEDGWMYFGGVIGIDYFHPDSISSSNTQSRLAFTNVKIANIDYVEANRSSAPVIELNPDNRLVTIEFSSLDYSDQQKVQYAYRLGNSEWTTMGNQNVLTFTNLPVGEHQLSVRSTNGEGVWLDNTITCGIIVDPWWWQSSWFRLAIALIGTALLIGAVIVYYQRKLERERNAMERRQAIEKERTRIATDMHDDLGANLSRIKFLSETVSIKKEKDLPITDEINGIRHYANDMIDRMGEIVWALNEKHDSLNDLIAYTRAFAVEYLLQNGLEVDAQSEEVPNDASVSGEYRRNVYLAVKEALHNVVKHAGASRVEVSIMANHALTIRIRDNGKGLHQQPGRREGNGVNNMKKRMEALGGKFSIEGNEGTIVTLLVPLN